MTQPGPGLSKIAVMHRGSVPQRVRAGADLRGQKLCRFRTLGSFSFNDLVRAQQNCFWKRKPQKLCRAFAYEERE
jgi:hypothetical protein